MISLLDILPKELIILDFHAKDKDAVLVQIADLFYEKNMVHKFYNVYAFQKIPLIIHYVLT